MLEQAAPLLEGLEGCVGAYCCRSTLQIGGSTAPAPQPSRTTQPQPPHPPNPTRSFKSSAAWPFQEGRSLLRHSLQDTPRGVQQLDSTAPRPLGGVQPAPIQYLPGLPSTALEFRQFRVRQNTGLGGLTKPEAFPGWCF